MALASLALVADLDDRGIDTSDPALAQTMLDVASASVRDAAGTPISEEDSVVVLYAWGDTILHLPGQPVTAVSAVELDGEAVASTEYTFVGEGLWRSSGWGSFHQPSTVQVTMTHGLTEVPADIVDLVCNLAAAGIAGAATLATGGTFDPRVAVEAIDDYRVEWASGADSLASVFDLPAGTRARLRARFGGGAAVVETR